MKPATINLEKKARLSLRFLQASLDKKYYIPYFYIVFQEDPAEFRHHSYWDFCENPARHLYGMLFSRLVTGENKTKPVEARLRETIYSNFSENDGMSYRPASTVFGISKHATDLWENRSIFTALYMSYLVDKDKKAKKCADGIIEGLQKFAIKKGNGCYFSKHTYNPGYKPGKNEAPVVGQNMGGWLTPLVKYYEYTGNKKAFSLACGLANFLVEYLKKGIWFSNSDFNTHSMMFTLAGILRLAGHTGNKKHIEWVKKQFDYIIKVYGSSFGWIAEQALSNKESLKHGYTQSCESCTVTDAIDTAMLLAKSGYPQYWNIAEKFIRNYFDQAQLTDSSWMTRSASLRARKEDTIVSSFKNIPQRSLGCYVGWGGINDFVHPAAKRRKTVQNCCGPHCAYGTFLIWNNIVTKTKEGVWINLSLNRDTKWAQVNSYIPYEGKVEITMRTNADLHVRIPGNVNKNAVNVYVNGNKINKILQEGYIVVKNLKIGQQAVVEYPLEIEKKSEKVMGKEYKLEWKGDTVINISPSGKIAPFFKRTELKTAKAQFEKTKYNNTESPVNW